MDDKQPDLPSIGVSCREVDTLLSAAFRAIMRSSRDIIYIKDTQSRYMAASESGLELLHLSSEDEIIGKRPEDFISDAKMVERYYADDRFVLENKKDLTDYVEEIPEKNGSLRSVSGSKYYLADHTGKSIGILCVLKDITRECISRQHQQQALQMLFTLPVDAYSVVLIDVDEWRIIAQRQQLVHDNAFPVYTAIDDIGKKVVSGMVDSLSEAAGFFREFSQEKLQEDYQSGQAFRTMQYQWQFPNGDVRWIQNHIRYMLNMDHGHLCAILSVHDVDRQKKAEQELILAAQTDQMTKVLNRETTMRRIREVLTAQKNQTHAFFMLDIDNFKQLNDTYGHRAGDVYLVEFADILRNSFRETDVVGRIGGDEFFVLMRNISHVQMVRNRAKELMDNIHVLEMKYPNTPLSISMGITFYPGDGGTLEELYEKADLALYSAKRSGKNKYIMSVPESSTDTLRAERFKRKEGNVMTLREFYHIVGGDYQDVMNRLHSEDIVIKFLVRLMEDTTIQGLEKAVAEENQQEAFTMIHTFKGICLNMGLGNLAAVSAEMTDALRTGFPPEVPVLLEKVMWEHTVAIDAIRSIQEQRKDQ